MVVGVNHVPGFGYDLMGNVNNDGANTYTYDAEGRQITVNGNATTFDTFNRAIEIQSGIGSYAQVVYAPSGQKFAVMNGTTVLGFKAPMAAGMAAVRASDGMGYFQHADWLGSSRFASTGGGTVAYDRAYAPFGEPYAETATTNRDFTGQTQDTVSGLYDFLLRQQSSAQGRWLTPDPASLAAVDITNPQTWNRYAYVANNPLNAIDPLGLMMCLVHCPNWMGGGGEPSCLSCNGGLFPGSGSGGGIGDGGIGGGGFGGGSGLCIGPVCISGNINDGGIWGNIFNGVVNGDWSGLFPGIPGYDAPPIFDAVPANNGQQQSPARQQCEANAEQKFQTTFNSVDKGFYPNAGQGFKKGAAWGALAGCAVTWEVGCGEGAVPGFIIGGLAGAGKSMWGDLFTVGDAYLQKRRDMEACEAIP